MDKVKAGACSEIDKDTHRHTQIFRVPPCRTVSIYTKASLPRHPVYVSAASELLLRVVLLTAKQT